MLILDVQVLVVQQISFHYILWWQWKYAIVGVRSHFISCRHLGKNTIIKCLPVLSLTEILASLILRRHVLFG